MGNRRHFYLLYVGTAPGAEGKGFCRKILEGQLNMYVSELRVSDCANLVLRSADEQKVECYLEATKPALVNIYNRFGFALEEELSDPGNFTIYCMRRPAAQ
jgi:hypothetical protein